LDRFKVHGRPENAIAGYLLGVWKESRRRGYHFDRSRIARGPSAIRIPVTRGQLEYELSRLRGKLQQRDPERFAALGTVKKIQPHPVFSIVAGPVETWEKRS
jgi:hypothetical protein